MESKRHEIWCGQLCLLQLTEKGVQTHSILFSFHMTIEPPDLHKHLFRAFFITCYMLHVTERGSLTCYRKPAVSHKLFRRTWLRLKTISKATYDIWRAFSVPTGNSIAFSLIQLQNQTAIILPVRIMRTDALITETIEGSDTAIVLSPQQTMKSFYEVYIHLQTNERLKICLFTFINVLDNELSQICVSFRSRGICDVYFAFSKSIWMTAGGRLQKQEKQWFEHLNAVATTGLICRLSVESGWGVTQRHRKVFLCL